MTKKLERWRNFCYIFIILKTFLVGVITFTIDTDILHIILLVDVLESILCLIGNYIYSNMITHDSLSVKETLSDDAGNAFVFGGIGLLKYDESRNIIWVSDLFRALEINPVGEKVLEWQPQLASLFDDEDIKTVDVNSRKYEVYNNQDTHVLYFKDVTDYLTVSKDYEDQRICFAYVTIDNYEDSINNADEDKASLLQTTVRQLVVNWAKENNIIIKRYKSGCYVAVFDERTYRKQVEEHFAILTTFKSKMEEMHEFMTMSIGIGRGNGRIRELDEMAFAALNLSYSRGGDQVSVKTFDEKVRYFGGNTESSESNNRVRSRVIAQTLGSLIRQASNVIIMGHKTSDLDSFGASIAVYKICKAYHVPTNILIDLESCEDKTSNVVREFLRMDSYKNVFVTPLKSAELKKSNTLLIMVDHHKKSLSLDEAIVDMIGNKVVIDHHRRGEEFVRMPILTYLEPAASSAIELVTELYEYQNVNIELTSKEATTMYAGMLVDTNYFKTRIGSRTLQVAAKLKDSNANISKAYELLEDNYSELKQKISITSNAYIYKNEILIAYGTNIYKRPDLAKAGNELLVTAGVQAVFTIGRISKDEIAISARSKTKVNVQVIMEKLGGGGHFSMAACGIRDMDLMTVRRKLESAIDEYLEEREDVQ